MSIKQRISESEVLWNMGLREGAWIMTMIATAGTARKRYPKPIGDKESFCRYIRDVAMTIISGKPIPSHIVGSNVLIKLGDRAFEDVLYEDFRCFWIHEAGLDGAGLTESKVAGEQVIETLVVGKNMQLPDHWVHHLMNAIRWSPENASEFP